MIGDEKTFITGKPARVISRNARVVILVDNKRRDLTLPLAPNPV